MKAGAKESALGLHQTYEGPASWQMALPYLDALANSLESGMLVIDGQQRIVLCSESMAATFGLPAEAVLDMTPETLMNFVASLVDDPPPVIRDRGLLPVASRITCEEFELSRPNRSVVRWVARRLSEPQEAIIVVCTDITAEVDLVAAYERLSMTDRLTGLSNRRGAEQFLRRESSKFRRYGGSMSTLILDVDHFKSVNDTYGHTVGDQVLRAVGATIADVIRVCDFAARWGGEEFLVVLPNTDLVGARDCAERLRLAVQNIVFPGGLAVTISAGAAEMSRHEEVSATIARADELLYIAKNSGRNCVRWKPAQP